jgi:hypothetical protein
MTVATGLAVEVRSFYFHCSTSGVHIPLFVAFTMHSPSTHRTLRNLRIDLACLLLEQSAGEFFCYLSTGPQRQLFNLGNGQRFFPVSSTPSTSFSNFNMISALISSRVGMGVSLTLY